MSTIPDPRRWRALALLGTGFAGFSANGSCADDLLVGFLPFGPGLGAAFVASHQ